MTQEHEPRPAPTRTLVRRVLAALLALAAGLPMFGLIDLGTLLGLADPAYEWSMPLEASWGAFFTFVVGGGYLWVAVGRVPRGAVVQLALAAVALVVASAVAADPRPLPVALAVAVSLLLLCLLDPRLLPKRDAWSWTRSGLVPAVTAAAVWLPYSAAALAAARSGRPGDDTNGIDHWPVQAALGLVLVLGAVALAARGTTPTRVALVLSAVVIGLTDLVYPDRNGATGGPVWAWAAMVWALLVAAAPLLEARSPSRAAGARAGRPRAATSAVPPGEPD